MIVDEEGENVRGQEVVPTCETYKQLRGSRHSESRLRSQRDSELNNTEPAEHYSYVEK
jgi:hypothetical protein